MCGRFAQAQTREEYLSYLADEADRDIAYHRPVQCRTKYQSSAPERTWRAVTSRSNTLGLRRLGGGINALINVRAETASTSCRFKPLWQHGRAICFADGWFEWKKEGENNQPYFIHRANGQPIFMAVIWSTPFERSDETDGVLIVTAAAGKGLVDIHDRHPLVLTPEAAREWIRQDIPGIKVEEIASGGTVETNQFIWHPVTHSVRSVEKQGPELILPIEGSSRSYQKFTKVLTFKIDILLSMMLLKCKKNI